VILLCALYCIPLAWFLYYASSGIVFVIAMFALKRGIYGRRQNLRSASFFMMFLGLFKALMIDLPHFASYFSCAVLFAFCSAVLLQAYRIFMPDRKREPVTPQQVHLRFWANVSLWAVLLMICWLAAPWVGYLTVGAVPAFVGALPWQAFAFGNLFLLLLGFWKAESCVWEFQTKDRKKMAHLASTWTPRDTLWMTVFLYLIALAMTYASRDILSMHGTL
jgi:hypothetical protein